MDLSEVGSSEDSRDSVQCHTDLCMCCSRDQGPDYFGDWYFSNGARLGFSSGSGDVFQLRGAQRVELHRRNNALSPSGIYHCEIPTNAVHNDSDITVRETVYVGIYASGGTLGLMDMYYRIV